MKMLTKSVLINTLLVLCVCTFLVYQVQEVALQNMGNLEPPPPPILSSYQIMRTSTDYQDVEQEGSDEANSVEHQKEVKIWITMGLCWSANTKYHGKSQFPYREAAPLSSELWMKLTPARVILQIVYSEPEATKEMLEYKSDLENKGAIVKLVRADDMKCVLKAQLIRLLGYQLPQVSPDDILVTADVDAFVMTPDIALPLLKLKQKLVWIYRYELTLNSGYTFMMPFIGARARVWDSILEYDDHGGLPGMVERYRKHMNFSEDYTWDIDQHVVSHAILKSGLCSLPASNGLWKEVNLEPKPVKDSKTCWHGGGVYEDCNNKLWTRNLLIRYHGQKCKWWHFYPDEKESALQQKFEEILSGKSEKTIFNSFVSKAKKLQQDYLGKVWLWPR